LLDLNHPNKLTRRICVD